MEPSEGSAPGLDEARASAAFGQLHEKVQRWIWRQGWTALRDIQERSIPALIGGDRDVIIGASTASGKTEAAFLPIVSRLAWDDVKDGFGAIYISPLRALINDQFGRLDALCEDMNIPVFKWHGDVAAGEKERARRRPEGVLLITPESVEALFVRRGPEVIKLFRNLRYTVIDELHAFFGSPRGKQLQSLMHRIEVSAGRRIPRVGLSATLADMKLSAEFLRPLDPQNVEILESIGMGQELKLQLRGYLEPARARVGVPERPRTVASEGTDDGHEAAQSGEDDSSADNAIAHHLFKTLRGQRSLVFAGSRNRVELYTAKLNELTEQERVPEEFFAHHGSLSREYREHAEQRMKEEDRPASVVCTTTLELGIDVGHIESVAQLGPGQTVSGMRQRLGRSGRRPGKPSIMRIYAKELQFGERIHPLDALRRETIQCVAMVNLMLAKWNEPPTIDQPNLSTLTHQILALIAQHGGLTAKQAWQLLVESKVFSSVSMELFKTLLRRLADSSVRILEQAPDGTLLPGEAGERIIQGRDFYAVFQTPEEYRVITDRGRALGTLPLESPYQPGQLIIFGGRRWRIFTIDASRKEIVVTPARGGRPPAFGGTAMPPADGVIAEMKRVYEEIMLPGYLDKTATQLVQEARGSYDLYSLRTQNHLPHGDMILLFPWVGPQAQQALLLALEDYELEPMPMGLAIGIPSKFEMQLRRALDRLAAATPPDPVELAYLISQKLRDKYDWCLGDDLLAVSLAADLDTSRVPALCRLLSLSLSERYAEKT